MSDLDLDSLLADLDTSAKAPAASAAPAAKPAPATASLDDLDSLLGDLDAASKAPAPKAAPAAAPAPKPAPPKQAQPATASLDDLDSLLGDLDAASKAPAPKPAPVAAKPAPKPAAAPAPKPAPPKQAQPATASLDDLDSLLGDLDSVSAAAPKSAPPAAKPAAKPAPKPAAAPAPKPAPPKQAQPVTASLDDLDSLLGDLDNVSAAAPPAAKPAPKPAPAAAPAPKPAPPKQAQPATASLDDLDSLLGDLNGVAVASGPAASAPPPSAAPASARPAVVPPPASSSGPVASGPSGNVGNELDSLMANLQSNMSALGGANGAGPVAGGAAGLSRGICGSCGQPILGEVVQALGRMWHPEHFVCVSCRTPLGTTSFYESQGSAYCANCWKTMFCPRCAHCDQPITDRCITALGKKWHPEHFICCTCLQPLTSGFLEREGKPFCERCFYTAFSFKCAGCGQPIRGQYINAMGSKWHPEHFSCFYCHKSFNGGAYFEYQGKPYCEMHYHQMTGAICAGCGQPVGTRSIDALGKKWHPEHFVCAFCNSPLSGTSFKEQAGKAYCAACHAKLF